MTTNNNFRIKNGIEFSDSSTQVTAASTLTSQLINDSEFITTSTLGDIRFQGSWIRNKDTGNIYISPQDGNTWITIPSDSQNTTDAIDISNYAGGGVRILASAPGESSAEFKFNRDGITFTDASVQTTAWTGTVEFSALGGLALDGPSEGQVLTWNNTQGWWENRNVTGSSSTNTFTTINLNGLTLAYDTATHAFIVNDTVITNSYLPAEGLLILDGATDSSTFAQTLTFTGGATTYSGINDPWATETPMLFINGGNVSVPYDADFNFGSNDFTIDFWFYALDDGTYSPLGNWNGGSGLLFNAVGSGGQQVLYFYGPGPAWQINTPAFNINEWHHIAVSRNSGVVTIWLDGVAGQTYNSDVSFIAEAPLFIGSAGGGPAFNGFMTGVRIVDHIALWSTTFTPPVPSNGDYNLRNYSAYVPVTTPANIAVSSVIFPDTTVQTTAWTGTVAFSSVTNVPPFSTATSVSQLTNDSGYLTSSTVGTYIPSVTPAVQYWTTGTMSTASTTTALIALVQDSGMDSASTTSTNNIPAFYDGSIWRYVFNLEPVSVAAGGGLGWTPTYIGVAQDETDPSKFTNNGSVGDWVNRVYSAEGSTTYAKVTFQATVNTEYAIVGLNTDPETTGWPAIDYCWFVETDGNTGIIESGNFPKGTSFTTYTTDTVFAIEFDGTNINYIQDGTTVSSVARIGTGPLKLEIVLNTVGEGVRNVVFEYTP